MNRSRALGAALGGFGGLLIGAYLTYHFWGLDLEQMGLVSRVGMSVAIATLGALLGAISGVDTL